MRYCAAVEAEANNQPAEKFGAEMLRIRRQKTYRSRGTERLNPDPVREKSLEAGETPGGTSN